MKYDMAQGLDVIAPIIQRNKLIIVAGAGFSIPSGLPSWAGLIQTTNYDALLEEVATEEKYGKFVRRCK